MGNGISTKKMKDKKDWAKMRPTQSRMQTTTGLRDLDQGTSPNRLIVRLTKKEREECYQLYKKKIHKSKKKITQREMEVTGIRNMTVENTLQPIRQSINRLLNIVFPENMQKSQEFLVLKKEVFFLEDRKLISTFAYLKWEKDFIDLVKDKEMNPYVLMQYESKRFSDNLFEKVNGNLFLRLATLYDKAIAQQYYDKIVTVLMLTCKKCENLKKVILFEKLLKN